MPLSPVLAYKCRAASLSLVIFAAFAILLSFVTTHYWYPDYLFRADGGVQGLRLVLMVDCVLGPVLALVFFHPEKSRGKLLFDLVVIAGLQLSAMAWGTWQVWSQRPIAVVYGNHRFVSVTPDIMRRQGEGARSLARFSGQRPPYVFRRPPASGAEERRQLAMIFRYAFHPESHAFLFTPLGEHLGEVFERQAALRTWLQKEQAVAWQAWLAEQAVKDPAQYRLAFFEGRYRNAVLVFTPAGDYAGSLDLGKGLLPYLDEKTLAAGEPASPGPAPRAEATGATTGRAGKAGGDAERISR